MHNFRKMKEFLNIVRNKNDIESFYSLIKNSDSLIYLSGNNGVTLIHELCHCWNKASVSHDNINLNINGVHTFYDFDTSANHVYRHLISDLNFIKDWFNSV